MSQHRYMITAQWHKPDPTNLNIPQKVFETHTFCTAEEGHKLWKELQERTPEVILWQEKTGKIMWIHVKVILQDHQSQIVFHYV